MTRITLGNGIEAPANISSASGYLLPPLDHTSAIHVSKLPFASTKPEVVQQTTALRDFEQSLTGAFVRYVNLHHYLPMRPQARGHL